MNRRRFIRSSFLATVGIILFPKLPRKNQSSTRAIGGTFTITSRLNDQYVCTTEPIRFDATEKEVQEAVDRSYDKIITKSALLLRKNTV